MSGPFRHDLLDGLLGIRSDVVAATADREQTAAHPCPEAFNDRTHFLLLLLERTESRKGRPSSAAKRRRMCSRASLRHGGNGTQRCAFSLALASMVQSN